MLVVVVCVVISFITLLAFHYRMESTLSDKEKLVTLFSSSRKERSSVHS